MNTTVSNLRLFFREIETRTLNTIIHSYVWFSFSIFGLFLKEFHVLIFEGNSWALALLKLQRVTIIVINREAISHSLHIGVNLTNDFVNVLFFSCKFIEILC